MYIPPLILLVLSSTLNSVQADELRAEENSDLFEGDIEISEAEEEAIESGAAGAGIIGTHYRWPNRLIPYEISPEFSKHFKKL